MTKTKKSEEEVLEKSVDRYLLKRLLSYLKPYKWYILMAFVLTVIISALSAVRPRLTPVAIDEKIPSGDINGLLWIVIILLGTLVIQAVIQYLMTYLTSWIGQKIIFDLRRTIYRHILNLDVKYYDRTPIGRLVTRVTNDVDVLFEVFSSGIVSALGDVFSIIWILIFMFTLDYKLTFITLSVLPLLMYATSVFRKKVRDAYGKIRILIARINSYIQEHISGITIVQLFGKEKRTKEEFEIINQEHTRENKRSVTYYAIFFPVVEFLSAVSVGLIIWYGGGQVFQSVITVGVIISFLQYTEMFFRPIRDLSEKYNILQTAMASSERIFELLDTKPEVNDPVKPIHIPEIKGEIEFRNVNFAYNDENYVLKDISFKINPGERVAFVGATGAGKTTIINLINRFYDIEKGEILLDGININRYKQKELRNNIKVVLQDVFLFSGDIKYNVNLGNENISDEDIYAALESVGIGKYVDSLPGKINYQVSERGSSLSVGQRQLISFARALVFDPKILILDEATSSVDTETEHLIQQAIQRLILGRTSIIIAHRLSTIQSCDKIIVMHKGEIKEMGNHQQLLAHNGLYYKLYQLQYKEELIEK
jgi:ATP-binding cassette subfamily B protein